MYDNEKDYSCTNVRTSAEDCKSKFLERLADTKKEVSFNLVNDSTRNGNDVEICWNNNFGLIRYINHNIARTGSVETLPLFYLEKLALKRILKSYQDQL